MIYVDASFIIALVIEKDQWHQRALELLPKLKSEDKFILAGAFSGAPLEGTPFGASCARQSALPAIASAIISFFISLCLSCFLWSKCSARDVNP